MAKGISDYKMLCWVTVSFTTGAHVAEGAGKIIFYNMRILDADAQIRRGLDKSLKHVASVAYGENGVQRGCC